MYRKQTTSPGFIIPIIFLTGIASAFNYELFIFPNNFAPSGINGIATLIQYLFNFKLGYLSLAINIPLLVISFFVLSHKYAYRTLIFIIAFSFSNIIFRSLDLSGIVFHAVDGGEALMASVAGGVFNGFFYSIAIRLGGSTGGNDLIASFFNKYKPEFELIWIIFAFNAIVAVMSFFVFGRNFRPVLLCIIYSFVTTTFNDRILKSEKSAVKFEAVTSEPQKLAKILMEKLKHGCTVIPAKGMFSEKDKYILICVVNKHQICDFQEIIREFDDTFTIVTPISMTYGNFKHIK